MIFLKIGLCSCSFLLFSFFLREVELEIQFSTYFIRRTCWFNSSSFKWKIQKIKRHIFLVKIRYFSTKLNIFLTNPNDNLKNRCHSKIILGHAVFQLLFESNFSLQLSLLLNSSIRWQWLLFHLIKARGKYKQVIKFR